MATYWENSCSFGLRYVSWYKYLIVSFFFSHLGFWSGNLFLIAPFPDLCLLVPFKKVQVGKDQEKAQSEKDSHSKNQGGKKPNQQSGTYTMKTFRKPNEQLFSQ